jgi:hypothetical protein
MSLVFGELFSFARHTVTQGLLALGLTERDWSAFYRLFSRARFEEETLANCLLRETLAHVPAKEAYMVGMDGTSIHRSSLIAIKSLPEDKAAHQRRSAAVGTYRTTNWGFPGETIDIGEANGKLTWAYEGGMEIRSSAILTEVQPGLYFSEEGNLVDLRGPAKLIDNIRLIKEDPRTMMLKAIFLTICGLVFLSALLFWPLRAIIRRLRRKSTAAQASKREPVSHLLVAVSILAGLAALFGMLCLSVFALAPALIYVPWPLPFVDIGGWQFALFSLPLPGLVLALGVIALAILAMRSQSRARFLPRYYLAVGFVLLAFNSIIFL